MRAGVPGAVTAPALGGRAVHAAGGRDTWLVYTRAAVIVTMFLYGAGYAAIGFGLLFFGAVGRCLTGRWPLWQATELDRPLAAFAGVLVLSMIASPYIRVALPVTLALIVSGAVYFGSFAWLLHRDPEVRWPLVRAWALGSALAALAGLAVSIPTHDRAAIPRGVGPNGLGTTLLLGTILALGLALRTRGIERVSWLFCAAAGLLGVLASGSRASLAGLILGVLYLAWRALRARPWHFAAALAVGIVALMLAGVAAPQLAGRLGNTLKDFSSNRLQIWRASHRMISALPVLGTGFGTFERAYEQWKAPNSSSEPFAFNLALNIAVETGLAGLVAAVWIAVTAASRWVRAGRRAPPEEIPFRVLLGALWLGLLVDQLADNTLFSISTSAALWLLLALLVVPASAERSSA